jgi:hypothetical protein
MQLLITQSLPVNKELSKHFAARAFRQIRGHIGTEKRVK